MKILVYSNVTKMRRRKKLNSNIQKNAFTSKNSLEKTEKKTKKTQKKKIQNTYVRKFKLTVKLAKPEKKSFFQSHENHQLSSHFEAVQLMSTSFTYQKETQKKKKKNPKKTRNKKKRKKTSTNKSEEMKTYEKKDVPAPSHSSFVL